MNVVISIQEYELAQGERLFRVLTQSGSALTRRTDQIPGAVDFLVNVLPSYNPEQIPDARGGQDSPGDSPVRIS